MDTRFSSLNQSPPVLTIDAAAPQADRIAHAARIIRNGGLVVFPTETVYGLGANALDATAVARIYAAKGRPMWNPVIAHVACAADAREMVTSWTDEAERLATTFWPGPLTLVLPKRDIVPDVATAGLPAIGVRVPHHPVALALLRAAGCPIAAPSANRFTQVSPTTAQHALESLGDRVDLVLDGGPCDVGIESTVLDLTGDLPAVLRPGMITRAQIATVLGRDVLDRSERIVPADATATPQHSPGMADRHYAPRADVWLFDFGDSAEIARAMTSHRERPMSGPITALVFDTTTPTVHSGDRIVRMPTDPSLYARQLYAVLHDADAAGAAVIVIERPPHDERWAGVRNRLERSSR